MFGAPIGNLCVNEPKNQQPVNENVEVRETFVDSNEQPMINGETTLAELCSLKESNEALAANIIAENEEQLDLDLNMPDDPTTKATTEAEAEEEEANNEEFANEEAANEEAANEEAANEEAANEEMVESFGNRVVFGQRFLSLDLALRAVLYALLFYIVAHKDTQALLKGVVKVLPKAVKPFTPMVLFGLLYYVLNLFI